MEPQKIEPNLAVNSLKKTYKHHWVIGFIIVFSLVHIFLSFYVSIRKDSKSNCVSGAYCGEEHSDVYITLIDGTIDWKTYKNEELGFEFKYPKDWGSVNDNIRRIDKNYLLYTGTLNVVSTTTHVLKGVGLPPVTSMWVNIVPVEICDDPSYDDMASDFVLSSKPDIAEKSICLGPFKINVGLWQSDPDFIIHKNILISILASFKYIDSQNSSVISPPTYMDNVLKWNTITMIRPEDKYYLFVNTGENQNTIFPETKVKEVVIDIKSDKELMESISNFEQYYKDYLVSNGWVSELEIGGKLINGWKEEYGIDNYNMKGFDYYKLHGNNIWAFGIKHYVTDIFYSHMVGESDMEYSCPCKLHLQVYEAPEINIDTLK